MATSFLEVKNRATSTLASAVTAAATTWNVASGEGSNFPASGTFHLTCEDEIVACTSRTGDALTVTRAQEGTSAAAHAAGAAVKLNITAQHLSDIHTAVNTLENASTVDTSGTPVANDFARFTDANTIEGRSYAEVKADLDLEIGVDVLAQQTIGIADDNLVEIDSASVASGEYAKFTANGLESKSYAEVRSDLNVADGADVTGDNAPQAHAASHENGGSDEISLAGLSGTPADLTTHMADTTTHGTSGDIVGTSDTQTLTNKTLTTPVVASLYQDAGKTKLLTMPAATDTLVGKDTTDTLTNKTLTSPAINGTVTTTGLTMPAMTMNGDISMGANKLKTTNHLIKEEDATWAALRNAADDAYSRIKLLTLGFSNDIRALSDALSIDSPDVDDNYLRFRARDNGSAVAEVARLQGAADPYFQATLPMVLNPSAAPGTLVEGHFWYDATADKIKYRDASATRTLIDDNTLAAADDSTKGIATFEADDFDSASGKIDLANSVAKSVPTDSGTATPSTHAVTIAGGEGIDTSASGATVTIAGEDATSANKGIASFDATDFTVTAGNVALAANGHGSEAHTNVTRTMFIPCGNKYTGGTHFVNYDSIALDPTSDEYVQFDFRVPSDFVSFGSLKLVWMGDSSATAGYDWRVSPTADYAAANEGYTTHQDTPADSTIDVAATRTIYETDIGFTLSSLALGDYVGVEITRDADHADDTYEDDILVMGLLLTYTANQ